MYGSADDLFEEDSEALTVFCRKVGALQGRSNTRNLTQIKRCVTSRLHANTNLSPTENRE